MSTITAPQLTRLQILYGQFERHSLDCPGSDRAARMAWATEAVHREISSFKDLTLEEGKSLIDGLQRALGTKVPSKVPRRPQTRKDGEKKGTEGRHDQIHAESTLVSSQQLHLIQGQMTRLGWNEARLTAFLTSTRGPNKGSAAIRTLGEANKVYWALKRIAADQEKKAS